MIERLEAVSFPLAGADAESPERRLDGLLDVVADVARAADGRAVVALDEVQDVLAVQEIVGALSAGHDRGSDRVSWVFVGPELSSAEQSSGRPERKRSRSARLTRRCSPAR